MGVEEKVDPAIEVVARHYAAQTLFRLDWEDDWEDYGDVGMYDFMEVRDRARGIADQIVPTDEEYKAAYAKLAARAAGVEA